MASVIENNRFNDYLIYKDGTVVSLLTGKHITKRVGPKGYYQINLCIGGKCKTFLFHRLMANMFIENPNNLPCVNHIDGNKLNNELSNLEWVTYSGTTQHALRTGLVHPAKGIETKYGQFTETDIKDIRRLYSLGSSQYKLAERYNTTRSAIEAIVGRKTYKWVI